VTKIAQCFCKNDFQDQRYGAGKRVFNSTGTSKGAPTGWRCTVCGKSDTATKK
jgi:hypothetical protein